MKVEVYADVICPWCYIGKRRVAAAVTGLADPPEVRWRSFQLAPTASTRPGPTAAEAMSEWWGERAPQRVAHIKAIGLQDGLELNLDRARPVNTFDAHRLLHLAADHGRQDQAWESLLRGFHTEGLDIADSETLSDLGTRAGLPQADVHELLTGDRHAGTVRQDQDKAREHQVTGVPSLVIGDGRPTSAVLPVAELRRLLSP
ncbi:DsbA family protein [Kibdelosporangium persicum]|uniref:Disulfide bond formation protein DsbA n=1 Tax=Kibdelosporangium persicum TaxID=2698649 RepID=A0ABX2EW46_9PSEU|nr:DsbA family oxidoreductase [Kibdelosporangium persicum]NRN63050.1 Disulfide bond formation protein DsbA [Kibdelosporangium persicum]